MGAQAKKKRNAESRAKRKAKKAEQAPASQGLAPDEPTTSDVRLPIQSEAGNSKGIKGAAPHVTSVATSTRRSTRMRNPSSKLISGDLEKLTSAKGHDDETIAARPQRSATAAAKSLLRELQISSTENSELEEDPEDGDAIAESDEGSDGGTGDDEDDESSNTDGSVESADDDDKEITSATRKGKAPAALAPHSVERTRKEKLQVINEEELESTSDESESESFDMTFEINDKARGCRKNLTLPSLTSWEDLQDNVSQIFNIHPKSLQLQYRFSNEKNNALPFDLHSRDDYVEMRNQLRPFVVPKILSTGKRSTTVRKLVVVQLFNKGMEGVSSEKGVKKSAKPVAPDDASTRKDDELFEKKKKIIEQLTEYWKCDVHSLPDKPSLCWMPSEQRPHGTCYPITQSNINFWASLVAREPKLYSVSEKPQQINILNHPPRRHGGSTNSTAPQFAPASAPPMPYGFYPPPPQFPYYSHPNPMQWAGPAGLPPHAPVVQPNPTAPQKHIRGPRISPWLQYCDRVPGREGENFSDLADKFDNEGYRTIDQLIGNRMSVENISDWFGIRKGIADLIIQYVEEDMALVRDGNFTMDLTPPPSQDRDWAQWDEI